MAILLTHEAQLALKVVWNMRSDADSLTYKKTEMMRNDSSVFLWRLSDKNSEFWWKNPRFSFIDVRCIIFWCYKRFISGENSRKSATYETNFLLCVVLHWTTSSYASCMHVQEYLKQFSFLWYVYSLFFKSKSWWLINISDDKYTHAHSSPELNLCPEEFSIFLSELIVSL